MATTYKVKEIDTSASAVGERKAYRMTGSLGGKKTKETLPGKGKFQTGKNKANSY